MTLPDIRGRCRSAGTSFDLSIAHDLTDYPMYTRSQRLLRLTTMNEMLYYSYVYGRCSIRQIAHPPESHSPGLPLNAYKHLK
jgi:hypothetical protein